MKYSQLVMSWLSDLGYSHCFFVAGGNSMHLLDGARTTMTCIPVVHEVAAGIAVEYFNEAADATGQAARAFALVTAGPGLTNILTAMAGAFLESRELLVVGGQVKSTDLASEGLRQRGIQEIDGLALAAPVSKAVGRIEAPISQQDFVTLVRRGRSGRKGPVLVEICLDVQGATVDETSLTTDPPTRAGALPRADPDAVARLVEVLRSAERPVLLFGGGVSRSAVERAMPTLREARLPVMTTWNGMDRVGADDPVYVGRPNTWGQRSANVLLQQCDVLIALGTRLGLQQTGFNWQGFAPLARVVQVDLDPAELEKGHPRVEIPVLGDANVVLDRIACADLPSWSDWLGFCQEVRTILPEVEAANVTGNKYLDPYQFIQDLSLRCRDDDVIVPCSSGGAFTVAMQTFLLKQGQTVITNKGLASMGYGLAGAIGASVASGRRTVLIEGDGGFTQNLQELATVAVNDLPVKIFLFSNEGYASIRMTQRNYFHGAYLGCDKRSGLGFPDWTSLFHAYGIPLLHLGPEGLDGLDGFSSLFESDGPAAFLVPIDPEQTYYPKITSRVTAAGGMESQPLHLMSPDLEAEVSQRVLPYLPTDTGDVR